MAGLWTIGTVQWCAEGADLHRLLTRIRDADVPCRDYHFRRTPDVERLFALCPARDYHRLRPLVRHGGWRVRIRRKEGWAFRLRPLRRRIGLPIGAALSALLLWWLSGRIWVVQTPPALSPKLTNTLPSFLASQGVSIGRPRNGIAPNDIEFQALEHLPGVVSVNVNMDGCVAHVEVVERAFGEEVKPPDIRLSNIVATRDGHLLSLTTLSGRAAVKAGSGVTKDMLLISGVVETSAGPLLRRAQGIALAETERTLTAEVPYTRTVLRPDETEWRQTTLSLFGFDIPLYTSRSLPEKAEIVTRRQAVEVGGVAWPIALIRRHIRPLTAVTVTYTKEQARQIALENLAAQETDALKDADVQSRTLRDESDDTVFRLVADYRCVEDIAREVVVAVRDEP